MFKRRPAWHKNEGFPFELLTRHRPPRPWRSLHETFNLPQRVLRRKAAVHEAGHVVAALVSGSRRRDPAIIEVAVAADYGKRPRNEPAGYVRWGPHTPLAWNWNDHAVMCAAGQQAEHRWLHEQGLLTEERAWAVEAGAGEDRLVAQSLAVAKPVRISFGAPGTADVDWQELLDQADRLLSDNWPTVIALAAALDEAGRLSGDEVVRIVRAAQ